MKLAFYKANTGTLVDRLIDLWTGKKGFSHVEIVFDKLFVTKPNKRLFFSSSPREGRVRLKELELDNQYWVFVDVDYDEVEIYKKCVKQLNKKYDWLGIIFWFVLPLKKEDSNKWWCSEICAYMLGLENYRIHPNKLYKIINEMNERK